MRRIENEREFSQQKKMKKDSMSRLLIDLDNYFMYLDEIISSSKMEKVKKSACQEYLDEIERVIQEIYDLQ